MALIEQIAWQPILWLTLWSTICALCSILGAEVIRDCFHMLSHANLGLLRWHTFHHQLYKQDYTVTSPEAYRYAQWRYDVPEALVMLVATFLLWFSSYLWAPDYQWGLLIGVLYSLREVLDCLALATGFVSYQNDEIHSPGQFPTPPSQWTVNRAYHWRHHFDDSNAYFCGNLPLIDKLMGTSLVLKGKTIAVTGASGTFGRALLQRLHQEGAQLIALSSQSEPVTIQVKDELHVIKTITWQVGEESALQELLEKVDILVLNHGINLMKARTHEAITQTFEVNTFSTWRLLELFLTTVRSPRDMAQKEVWVNTSEAEVSAASSPLYELSKRTLGDFITLRRLDSPCVIRKLILGSFKSQLNPTGYLSADWVAGRVVNLAKRDVRNIIVTVEPPTYILFPIKELAVSIYFKIFSA